MRCAEMFEKNDRCPYAPIASQDLACWYSVFSGDYDHSSTDTICQYARFYRAMLCIRGTSRGPVSVCPSVCLSRVGVLLKRLSVGSHKQHRTIAQGLQFSKTKDLGEIRPESPPAGAPNAGGVRSKSATLLSTNNRLYLENSTR